MKHQIFTMASAQIYGLTASPYYSKIFQYFAWNIMFSHNCSTYFWNLPYINLGNNKEESVQLCQQFKQNFQQCCIHDGDDVMVILDEDGTVRGIGSTQVEKTWVDVDTNFSVKPLKHLKCFISS